MNQMKTFLLAAGLAGLRGFAAAQAPAPAASDQKTVFQTSSPWIPEIDVRSDAAIVYGANDRPSLSFADRVRSWRDRGYQTDFMTGIAWGQYQDYFYGRWDGKMHLDQVQVAIGNDSVWHGRGIPYIVPVQPYIDYMKTAVVKKVIDAGITTLFFEEPEFWAKSGYSDAFKRAWRQYYGFPWRPQDSTAENTYLSSKLKYHLYYEAIKDVSSYAKAYGKSKGKAVKVYIATHSLVNYSSWQIVSPEASLASLPGIDGYIAQVWTGTAREPTYFDGLRKERVFENAFLEYGSMVSMTAPTGRRVYFLTDPIEDRHRDWGDYKRNYEATYTAEILYPMVDHYEVMPWPERIFTKPYRMPGSDQDVLIPHDYSTQILIMVNALNSMPLSAHRISGSPGIGVLMGNSLMFQRFPTHNGYEDPQFSNFYGQTLPLLIRGVPVETVHMENLSYAATLAHIKVLVMSYSNMKPLSETVHRDLSKWVRGGGVLVYCGRDDDPYQSVMEWWDTGKNHFAAASDQLFQTLDVHPRKTDPAPQEFTVGKGKVFVIRQDPKEFVLAKGGDSAYLSVVRQAYSRDAHAGPLVMKNSFYLERGPYDIVSVMGESVSDTPYVVKGPVIDLFDPSLPVLAEKTVRPGEQALLYDLSRLPAQTTSAVLASASRISGEKRGANTYSFVAKGPLHTVDVLRLRLPAAPRQVTAVAKDGHAVSVAGQSWDAGSRTLLLRFDNDPDGVAVSLSW